jgi:hypothetical protein
MKEIIPESTFKLAREKGFESKVIGKSVCSKYSKNPYEYLWLCELQKWIREIHDIHIEISVVGDSRTYHYEYTIIISNDRDYNDEYCFDSAKRNYNNNEYKTYEAALNDGLYEAVKLI